jgi:hypothetical protein
MLTMRTVRERSIIMMRSCLFWLQSLACLFLPGLVDVLVVILVMYCLKRMVYQIYSFTCLMERMKVSCMHVFVVEDD